MTMIWFLNGLILFVSQIPTMATAIADQMVVLKTIIRQLVILKLKQSTMLKIIKKINIDLHRLCIFSKAGTVEYKAKHMFQVMAMGEFINIKVKAHTKFFIFQVPMSNFILVKQEATT